MFGWLSQEKRQIRADWSLAAVPEGLVIQVVGDVHGCLDELEQVLAKLNGSTSTTNSRILIFLGDLIDRGPKSRQVIERVLNERDARSRGGEVRLIRGNHEQLLLDFMAEPEHNGGLWLRNGGLETLRSYGVFVDPGISGKKLKFCRDELLQKLPSSHLTLLQTSQFACSFGDYFFCHAGVDPDIPLKSQAEKTLLWTRDNKALDNQTLEKLVVHGHTPVKEASSRVGHINIDTGAYLTGKLTGLSLSGSSRQFFSSADGLHIDKRRSPE